MTGNTKCHLTNEIFSSPCPQGKDFDVTSLKQHGGHVQCPKTNCPFIQSETTERTRVILVGKPGGPQKTLVQRGA